MAASIIAKVDRDDFMHTVHKSNPEYGWDSNAGYLTKNHYNAIIKYGLSPLHRRSYNIKSLSNEV
jgi:ribonuclease HII